MQVLCYLAVLLVSSGFVSPKDRYVGVVGHFFGSCGRGGFYPALFGVCDRLFLGTGFCLSWQFLVLDSVFARLVPHLRTCGFVQLISLFLAFFYIACTVPCFGLPIKQPWKRLFGTPLLRLHRPFSVRSTFSAE